DLDERRLGIDDELPEPLKGSVLWLNVNGVHDVDLLRRVGAAYGIHALALEDIASTHQRAKVDTFDDQLVITVRMLSSETGSQGTSKQVSIAVGAGYVISFQEHAGDVFEPVRNRIRQKVGRIRSVGSDYLAYALVDVVVDNYFVVLESVSLDLEAIEDQVQAGETEGIPAKLRTQRANLIMIRRSVWPLREAMSTLARGDNGVISKGTGVFLRDLYDHVIQVIDIVESLRDLGAAVHDLYMGSVSNKMNEVMKMLTLVGTIFIPLTFVAGIYGMNFADMPELSWRWGYPVALIAMALIAGGLVVFFKRRGWL
ncbi:MAG: magnesium transporter, partial [Thalassolituus oleivorans]